MNLNNFKEFFLNKKASRLLIILGSIIALLIVFRLGVAVGFRQAIFASNFGEGYERNFINHRGSVGFREPMMGAHGGAGEVLRVDASHIIVKGTDGLEHNYVFTSKTEIRKFTSKITFSNIQIGDKAVVFGRPINGGEIEARLIRIIPSVEVGITGQNVPLSSSTITSTTSKNQ